MIKFRKAALSDLSLLYVWRNDPQTRQNSISTEAIPAKAHAEWLKASLSTPSREIYIGLESEIPVGSVRLDRNSSGWILSWTIAPEKRGKGLGKEMVKQATTLVEGEILAEIKLGNAASMKIAEYAGFKQVSVSGDLTHWKKTSSR